MPPQPAVETAVETEPAKIEQPEQNVSIPVVTQPATPVVEPPKQENVETPLPSAPVVEQPKQEKVVTPSPAAPVDNIVQDQKPVKSVDALALSITHDGKWDLFRGERIYNKEVIKDDKIPGHTTLKLKTFKKGTDILRPQEIYELFDTAEACIKFHQEEYKNIVNKDKIAEIRAEYKDSIKTFVPVVVDTDGNTYVGTQIVNFLAKKY